MKFVLNPLTGFFDVTGQGSSGPTGYYPTPDRIDPSVILVIPDGTQMIIHHFLDNQGLIDVQGMVTIIESDRDFGFPEQVLPGEIYAVPARRQVIIDDLLDNQGLIEIFGTLKVI